MTSSLAIERTGPLRVSMLFSCTLLLAALWFGALTRAGVATTLVFWPVQAWAALALATSALSRRALHRRLHFTLALLLLLSTWALPAWHLLMPQADWIAANEPTKPGLDAVLQISAAQARSLFHFEWVAGLWRAAWPATLIVIPACVAFLAGQMDHPLVPQWSRRLAVAGLLVFLFATIVGIGAWLSTAVAGSPTWFWAVLVIGLPTQMRSNRGFLLAVWIPCVVVLLLRLLGSPAGSAWLCDVSLALGGALALVCSLPWYARMEAITRHDLQIAAEREAAAAYPTHTERPAMAPPSQTAPFDLIEHLDSPQAQEGADKYTRE